MHAVHGTTVKVSDIFASDFSQNFVGKISAKKNCGENQCDFFREVLCGNSVQIFLKTEF